MQSFLKKVEISPMIAQALSLYTTVEQKISEEEFTTLAHKAKAQGWLGNLRQEIKERVEAYRTARDAYLISQEPARAREQEALLKQVERQLAIVEYLYFA